MRVRELLREALTSMWSARTPTVLVAGLACAMCAATLATVGRAQNTEEHVMARLQSAGSRVSTITDAKSMDLLTPGIVQVLSRSDLIERVVGVSSPADAVNTAIGSGGTRVALWQLVGDPRSVVTLVAGRWPRSGEALVGSGGGATSLGLSQGVGTVSSGDQEFPVVGIFRARDPFTDFDSGVLVAASSASLSRITVVARTAADALPAQSLALDLIGSTDPAALQIRSPETLVQVQAEVAGDVGSFGRSMLLAIIGGGGLLVGAVVLADTLVRRTDLGRRRALGATRGTVVSIVLARTTVAALLGSGLGVIVGLVLATRWNAVPGAGFVAGTVILTVYAAVIGALPAVVRAASRDPIRVLRTP